MFPNRTTKSFSSALIEMLTDLNRLRVTMMIKFNCSTDTDVYEHLVGPPAPATWKNDEREIWKEC